MKNNTLKEEVKKTIDFFVNTDKEIYGVVTEDTKETIVMQTKTDLKKFINRHQLQTLLFYAREGEEKEFFQLKKKEIEHIITNMPVTYGQDGKGNKAIAYLHYFRSGLDWWITEKDCIEEEPQVQAYGFACLGDPQCAEIGYISIQELIDNGVELDFYFEPTTIGEIKEKLNA